MKALFDTVSYDCSKKVTSAYSTSFSLAVRMLGSSIQSPIYAVYGFVRFADEIVDTFHDYNKAELLDDFCGERGGQPARGGEKAGQRLARHDAGGDLGDGDARRLGDERHGARGARIDL